MTSPRQSYVCDHCGLACASRQQYAAHFSHSKACKAQKDQPDEQPHTATVVMEAEEAQEEPQASAKGAEEGESRVAKRPRHRDPVLDAVAHTANSLSHNNTAAAPATDDGSLLLLKKALGDTRPNDDLGRASHLFLYQHRFIVQTVMLLRQLPWIRQLVRTSQRDCFVALAEWKAARLEAFVAESDAGFKALTELNTAVKQNEGVHRIADLVQRLKARWETIGARAIGTYSGPADARLRNLARTFMAHRALASSLEQCALDTLAGYQQLAHAAPMPTLALPLFEAGLRPVIGAHDLETAVAQLHNPSDAFLHDHAIGFCTNGTHCDRTVLCVPAVGSTALLALVCPKCGPQCLRCAVASRRLPLHALVPDAAVSTFLEALLAHTDPVRPANMNTVMADLVPDWFKQHGLVPEHVHCTCAAIPETARKGGDKDK